MTPLRTTRMQRLSMPLARDVVRDLAAGRPVSPPAEPGWWERPPVRFCSP